MASEAKHCLRSVFDRSKGKVGGVARGTQLSFGVNNETRKEGGCTSAPGTPETLIIWGSRIITIVPTELIEKRTLKNLGVNRAQRVGLQEDRIRKTNGIQIVDWGVSLDGAT